MRSLCVLSSCFLILLTAGCATTTQSAASYDAPLADARTALDEYVAQPDPAFKWNVHSTIPGDGFTTYVLDMTSQQWLTPELVNRTEWKHWLVVTVPDTVKHDTALLFIGGGRNGNDAPDKSMPEVTEAAMATQSVAALLLQVPNQPLSFEGEANERYEDDLIAYTWDKFLRTGEAGWLARLPMTKSAVRAMDALSAFTATPEGGGVPVNRFVISGGSKRGWTTWTTAAVDDRVVAIVPFVIDLLNLVPSFQHHWSVYGFWAPAVDDYVNQGIMEWTDTPEYREMLRIVEPYSYRERLTMPKLIVNATGDQFFLPDSSQFYWDGLKGPKYLRYVPNADHGLDDSDAGESLLSFYASVLTGSPLPEYNWSFPDAATIAVQTATTPRAVKLWQASNPTARDFRLETIGAAWADTTLEPTENGQYQASVTVPSQGWTAFMIELTFEGPGGSALKLTTPVRVVPDVTPHSYAAPETAPQGFMHAE